MAAQASSIDRLPDDIKSRLQELLQDPRVTQLQATAKINEILEAEGHDERVTKSSVNRYAVRMEEVGARIRQSRETAEMFISRVGAAPQGQTGLLINEMLRSMAFELTLKLQETDIDEENLPGFIDQVKALALAVQRLEQSATINVKLKREIRKQALEDAVKEVEKAGNTKQLKPETLSYIKQVIYGLA
jgi:hypothetical protein